MKTKSNKHLHSKKNQIPGKWKIPGSGFNQNSDHGIPVSLR